MKKWLIGGALLAFLLGLATYVVAGPYLALHGIRTALAEQDTAKLQKHVDFSALRVNLRAQMEAVKAHWEGQGAASFQSVSEAWKVQTQDIVDVLDTFEQNLTGTQRQYDADDAAASSNLGKYSSMLGN